MKQFIVKTANIQDLNYITNNSNQRVISSILSRKIIAGFTLAEILITLLIVGIVASIVVPSLIQDMQDAELKTAWKKEFAALSQVSNLIIKLDCGGDLSSCITDNSYYEKTKQIRDLYLNHMAYTKKCSGRDDTGARACASEYYGYVMLSSTYGDASGFIKSNGVMVTTFNQTTMCTDTNSFCGVISVDVNGSKGPNKVNKDVLVACQYNDRLIPGGITGCKIRADWTNSYQYLKQ